MSQMWCRAPAALWRRTSRSVVLLTERTPEPLVLEGAATLVWDLLEEPTSVAEAVELLHAASGVDEAQVRHDVEHVLAALEAVGAVAAPGAAG